jgi:hypothetical protein
MPVRHPLEDTMTEPIPPHTQAPPHPQAPDPRRRALIGLVVVVALVVGGLLLVRALQNMSRIQDCALSGRTNCAPIDAQPASN